MWSVPPYSTLCLSRMMDVSQPWGKHSKRLLPPSSPIPSVHHATAWTGTKFLWCTGGLPDMQRPVEVPASVIGQLLTGIELALVLPTPKESERHKSEKGRDSAAPGQEHGHPSPANCRHFRWERGCGQGYRVQEILLGGLTSSAQVRLDGQRRPRLEVITHP